MLVLVGVSKSGDQRAAAQPVFVRSSRLENAEYRAKVLEVAQNVVAKSDGAPYVEFIDQDTCWPDEFHDRVSKAFGIPITVLKAEPTINQIPAQTTAEMYAKHNISNGPVAKAEVAGGSIIDRRESYPVFKAASIPITVQHSAIQRDKGLLPRLLRRLPQGQTPVVHVQCSRRHGCDSPETPTQTLAKYGLVPANSVSTAASNNSSMGGQTGNALEGTTGLQPGGAGSNPGGPTQIFHKPNPGQSPLLDAPAGFGTAPTRNSMKSEIGGKVVAGEWTSISKADYDQWLIDYDKEHQGD